MTNTNNTNDKSASQTGNALQGSAKSGELAHSSRTHAVPTKPPHPFPADGSCAMFALCENKATTTRHNPILGDVPACASCAEWFDRMTGQEAEKDAFRVTVPPVLLDAFDTLNDLDAREAVYSRDGSGAVCDHFQSDGRGCCINCGHFHGNRDEG